MNGEIIGQGSIESVALFDESRLSPGGREQRLSVSEQLVRIRGR